jgi:hypothetical protein
MQTLEIMVGFNFMVSIDSAKAHLVQSRYLSNE